jgi:hypothetical protein
MTSTKLTEVRIDLWQSIGPAAMDAASGEMLELHPNFD